MPDNSLQAIRTKVRRLTRSPSQSQITDGQIDEYINTFILYDFPQHIRIFDLHTKLTFWTQPFIDTYETSLIVGNALEDYKNKNITVMTPVYCAGYELFYSQSREQFFSVYPMVNSIASIGTAGDGATTTYTGFINSSQSIIPAGLNQFNTLLKENVLFSSVDANFAGLALQDVPVIDAVTGYSTASGNLYDPNSSAYQAAKLNPPTVVDPTNTINYVTGEFTITFPTAPAQGVPINSQTVPYVPSRPQAMLYFDNKFTFRPVPDQTYQVNIEVFRQPTELLQGAQKPEIHQWWQYIAYGAAKKIFEDRMDLDSVALIMPEFKQQELLVLRKTIVQQTNQRTPTIYTENVAGMYGSGWYTGGGSF